MIGIGDNRYKLAVYIGNRPPLAEYQTRSNLLPASEGELAMIGHKTGNHWRKIINIYAKLAYMLNPQAFPNWQTYRDNFLLTEASEQALLFNTTMMSRPSDTLNIICGKTHAIALLNKSQVDVSSLNWLDQDFAINPALRLIVTPYFDYRQLSNAKLGKLVDIITSMP